MKTCEGILPGQCNAAYKLAEKEAQRTAIKYMVESECERDFGQYMCVEQGNNVWYPRMAGFITHSNGVEGFVQPFFTSFNTAYSKFGKALLADGREIGEVRDMDGHYLQLEDAFTKALPTITAETGLNGDQIQDSDNSVLNAALATYLVAEAIDEGGDYLSEREKSKRYKLHLKQGRADGKQYKVTSGTARIGKTNKPTTYKTSSQLQKTSPQLKKTVSQTKSTYKSSSATKTSSSGGFGQSGRSFGGYGG
nr:DUF1190 domain-containing protein [Vibrio ostreicida]